METKANYLLIGIATVVGMVLIMFFAMWMANSEYRSGYNEYDVVFDDPVRGLAEGGEVRFNGIKVGEVLTLRIDPDNTNRVIAGIRVSADVPIRTDSEAQLEPIGLTGVTLIQLSAGSASADVLRPAFGQPTPVIHGEGSQIDAIVARSEDIAMRASEAMASVRDLLSDENIARVTRILNNLEKVSDQLAAENSVINQSGRTAAELATAAQSISDLARQTQSDMAELDKAISEVQSAAQVASGRTFPEIAQAAEDIQRASTALGRLADDLEERPSLISSQAPRPTVELAQ